MRREKRFSLFARVVGGVSALCLVGVMVVFVTYGIGVISGVVLV